MDRAGAHGGASWVDGDAVRTATRRAALRVNGVLPEPIRHVRSGALTSSWSPCCASWSATLRWQCVVSVLDINIRNMLYANEMEGRRSHALRGHRARVPRVRAR